MYKLLILIALISIIAAGCLVHKAFSISNDLCTAQHGKQWCNS